VLKGDVVFFCLGGGEIILSGANGRKALDILLSRARDEEKLAGLKELGLFRAIDHTPNIHILTDFCATPQLPQRLGWKGEAYLGGEVRTYTPPAPQPEREPRKPEPKP